MLTQGCYDAVWDKVVSYNSYIIAVVVVVLVLLVSKKDCVILHAIIMTNKDQYALQKFCQ